MKTRMGFVSNSSTTSFCIYGVEVNCDKKTFEKVTKKEKEVIPPEPGCEHEFDRSKSKFCPECGEQAWLEVEDDDDYCYEDFEEYFSDMGLDCDYGYGEGATILIGRNIKDEEDKNITLEKLMEVRDKLKKIFPKTKPTFYCGVTED